MTESALFKVGFITANTCFKIYIMIKMRPELRRNMKKVAIILGIITFAIIILAVYKLNFEN